MGSGREPVGGTAATRAELDAALAKAWRVMDLPRPARTGVCEGCCMEPEIEADFLNHDAADLSDAYLRDWFSAAFSDDLSYEEMGWLLPRIMAALADGTELATVGEEVTLSRLPVSGYPDRWPTDAVRAVERFAKTLLLHRIAAGTRELDDLVCMLANGGIPVATLTGWLDALDDGTLASLLYANWCEDWSFVIPLTAFWHNPMKWQWWAWANSEALLDRMTHAGLAGDDRAARVSDVIAQHSR